jgi:hypothetical protein
MADKQNHLLCCIVTSEEEAICITLIGQDYNKINIFVLVFYHLDSVKIIIIIKNILKYGYLVVTG